MRRGPGLRVTRIGDRAAGGGNAGRRGLGGPIGMSYDAAPEKSGLHDRVGPSKYPMLEATADADQC